MIKIIPHKIRKEITEIVWNRCSCKVLKYHEPCLICRQMIQQILDIFEEWQKNN